MARYEGRPCDLGGFVDQGREYEEERAREPARAPVTDGLPGRTRDEAPTARSAAEGELSLARLALGEGEGDLRHVADHVARALVLDPAVPEIHELLAVLAGHPEGGPDLFDLTGDQPVFLGTVVARAHVLAAHGRQAEAIGLLVSAQCHDPDFAWADVPWVLDPALPTRLDPQEIRAALHRLIGSLRDPVPQDERQVLSPFLTLTRATVAVHPEHADLLWTASILLRRLGEPEEAVHLAARSERIDPSFFAAMALGYALRSLRRWDAAEAAWLRALSFDPDNLALYTDIGELLATAGRPDDGLAWVERALEKDPRDPAAHPTACGMRFERDGDVAHLIELADRLREHPENDHADGVLAHHCQRRFWLGHVPAPTEAIINVLTRLIDGEGSEAAQARTSPGTLTLSAPEPPSALLAFHQVLADFEFAVDGLPDPDLRLPVPQVFAGGPVRTVTRRIWRYEASVPHPAVPPPSEEAARALAAVATHRWRHPPAAYDDAVRLSALDLEDLLGVLAHPPALPFDDVALWPEWIRQVQAWACLGIAHHQGDQPWQTSDRRATLIDLAYGPEDWVCEAALLALITTSWVNPESRRDVAELVAWRFMAALQATRGRAVTILESLGMLVRATPEMHPDVRALAEEVLDRPAAAAPAGSADTGLSADQPGPANTHRRLSERRD